MEWIVVENDADWANSSIMCLSSRGLTNASCSVSWQCESNVDSTHVGLASCVSVDVNWTKHVVCWQCESNVDSTHVGLASCVSVDVNWTKHVVCLSWFVTVFVCLSVCYASTVLAVIMCLSVTSRGCTNMAKPRITLTMPYDSPGTLVFRCQKSPRNSNDITPTGAPNRGGVGSHQRFSTNISLHLINFAR